MLRLRKNLRKDVVIVILVCVAVIGFITWRLMSAMMYHRNHTIADVNGDSDFTLNTLTTEDILAQWYGYTMHVSGTYGEGGNTSVDFEWKDEDRDKRSMHAESFSGVAVLQATKTDLETLTLDISSTVELGNFRIVVTVDDVYYCDAKINQTVQIVLNDVQNKTVLIKLAGESASFHAEVTRTY